MKLLGERVGIKRAAAVAAVLFSASAPLRATGLRTKFGEVTVKGLKIGQEYSMNNLMNLPLRIVNIGAETEQVVVDVTPEKSAAVEGYEPTDGSWIKLDGHKFTVEPNHEAVTDIHINIPNDPKLLGRRFSAHIWSHTVPGAHSMYGAGLGSELLMEISSIPPTEDELKKKFVDAKLTNLDFTLYPTEGVAADVPLGAEFDLKKQRKVSIKLVNPNDAGLHFKIRSIPFWESLLPLPDGYEAAPQWTWVRPSTDTVAVDGNSIKETSLFANIPDDETLKGKSYVFVIAVEVLEQQISSRVYYELLMKTRGKQGEVK
jgi:hypothetical protein